MQAFYLARQPIYDGRFNVAAYELLFRSGPERRARFENGDQATSDVITSSVVDIGLDNLVGGHSAFINATEGFLHGELPLPDHRDRIVLEVLEDIALDDRLLASLRALSAAGYRLALDDFEYLPGCEPVLDLVDYVKLDVCALDEQALAEHVARIRPHGPRLLAEKVETHDMLARCQALGFDFYQGFFFCRPKLICGRRPAANRISVLQLMSRLQSPDTGMDELERLVTADPALSYRLLKYINSSYCGLPVRVTSIRQALVLAGTERIRSWATLLIMAGLSDDKPSELIATAFIRARMCELLGRGCSRQDEHASFTVGLMSVLDALLDLPMDQVVAGLPFDDDVSAALCEYRGAMGSTLRRVLAYERGVVAEGEDVDALTDAYLQAVKWAMDSQAALA